MTDLTIPYKYESREYQQPFIRAVNDAIKGKSDIRYFFQVWHRRSGKDKTDIADCIPRRLIQDPCLVKLIYPTLKMGRENMWDGIGSDGFRYRDHLPEGLRVGKANETSMKIEMQTKSYSVDKSTSIFQIGGSDNPDSLRGGNPKMVVFSEWSEHDPYAFEVIDPILKENGGIAIFNMTPKGDNHARGMYEYAKNNPKWYVSLLTAEDTGIWTDKELEEIRVDLIKRYAEVGRSESEANAFFEQEYMCSFESPVIGSYYGAGIKRADREGRIGNVPYIEEFPVMTFWDLGMDDSTSIWFMQAIGNRFRFIDYYENSGEGIQHYAKVLQEKGYIYGRHFAPHDIAVRELGTGKSRLETAFKLGIKFEVGPNLSIDDGIDACRSLLSRCVFDKEKTYRGVSCLRNYRKDWDDRNKVFRNNPKHDWSSHGADAFRTFGVGFKMYVPNTRPTVVGGVKPYIEGLG